MSTLLFEDPPRGARRGTKASEYLPLLEELAKKSNRDKWARIASFDTGGQASAAAHRLRSGKTKSPELRGLTWDFTSGKVDDETYGLYARCTNGGK